MHISYPPYIQGPTDVINMIAPKDDNTEGVSIKDTDMVLPRIHESLILNLGDFVTHDYCQQLVRKAFFEDSFLKKKPGMALLLGHYHHS